MDVPSTYTLVVLTEEAALTLFVYTTIVVNSDGVWYNATTLNVVYRVHCLGNIRVGGHDDVPVVILRKIENAKNGCENDFECFLVAGHSRKAVAVAVTDSARVNFIVRLGSVFVFEIAFFRF